MSDLTKQRDEWWNFGGTYHRSGTAQGTTTASGVLEVKTGFARVVVDGFASDEQTRTRVTATGGGPYQTQSTYDSFQWLTPNGTTARFRVRRKVGGLTAAASFTLASTTTAVKLRWHAFGY